MRKQHHLGLWNQAAFGPLLAIPAIIGAGLSTATAGAATAAAGAAAATGVSAATLGAASAAVGTASAAGGILSAAGAASGLLAGGAGLAAALRPTPKPPASGIAPTAPQFGQGLAGGTNKSLASLSPALALGGTGGIGAAPSPSGGTKTLLGQ